MRNDRYPGEISRRQDWIEDSLSVADGFLQHEIRWEDQQWSIEAEEIFYEWNKFPSFQFESSNEPTTDVQGLFKKDRSGQ